MIQITSGDFLAGGGGVTEAMTNVPGLNVRWVLNHDPIAIRTNMHNHKGVKHYLADFYNQDEHEMEKVDFVWASIECTQHSRANGGREKKIGSYTLGMELIRYIRFLQPLVIGIENVPEFKEWAPIKAGEPDISRKGAQFEIWKNTICSLGYDYHEHICNAADYGIPTRRVRYFAFFTKKHLQMEVNWPRPTHSKTGGKGFKKWEACRKYINLQNEGNSVFGRAMNPDVKKGHRRPLSANTMRRIAGGIRKYAPELAFIFQYYGTGLNIQSVDSPLNTVTTKDRHVLVTLEKLQFISDHVHTDNYNHSADPLNPILTRQTKQLITVDNNLMVQHFSGDHSSNLNDPLPTITTVDHNALITTRAQFLADYYSRDDTAHSIDGPANTIRCDNSKHLVSCFLSSVYNSNGKPEANNKSVEEPLATITTKEKIQFISAYYSSSGKQGSQNQSIENPLNAITTGTNKSALVTAIENGEFDFDIKMRFLEPEELSRISTFPEKYFTDPLLKLTKKAQTKLIGNAVPPLWAQMMIEPVIAELQEKLQKTEAV
jgi:DNA (cytosine-5)-methyltransferase 1